MPSLSITLLKRASPADFDAGWEVCDETRHVQSNAADESAIATELSGEQTEPALPKVFLHAIHAGKTPSPQDRR
jgi:hypothetical protein